MREQKSERRRSINASKNGAGQTVSMRGGIKFRTRRSPFNEGVSRAPVKRDVADHGLCGSVLRRME